MLLMARSALNLYECAVSTSNADFRLYEFLKNSRVIRESGINNKTVSCETALVLSDKLSVKVLVEDDGIEPTTPCLQSRCSPS